MNEEVGTAVNHPGHYNNIKGIECIDVVEYFTFNLGNTLKYLWRAGHKDKAKEIEDLEKARWYITRECELIDSGRLALFRTLPPGITRSEFISIIRDYSEYRRSAMLYIWDAQAGAIKVGWKELSYYLKLAAEKITQEISRVSE